MNGQEAWDKLTEFKNKGTVRQDVHCIITDIEMPLMDGHRLTKLCKSDDEIKKIPLIIFSSFVNEEMRKKGEQLGADAQLTKPEIGIMKQPVGLLSGGQRQALTLLMATMVTPKILLLDEHTAALDPTTAEKVLNLTKKIVSEQNITCLMVTHNMHQALELGNRTLMMDSGNIVLDVSGEEREKMSVDDLLEQFAVRAGKALDNDRILFSKVEA